MKSPCSLPAAIIAGLCLLCAAPSTLLAQGAPPVDESEGNGTTGSPLRIGSAVISGSVWLDGSMQSGATRPGDEDTDTFRVRRGRIGVAGSLSPRIGYSLSGELTSQPALRNAFLVLRLTEHVSVRLGQANPITALERGTSPLSLELIHRSEVTNTLTGPSDIGVTVFSPEPYRKWLGYALNISNGSGFNRPDDNDSKDVSGRVALSPVNVRGLMFVVSGARGTQPRGLRTRAGFGVDYRRGAWHVLAEGLRQRRDNLPVSDGYVAMATYRYRPKTPRQEFAQIEFAARVWVLNDRASAEGAPAEILNDDGGGEIPIDTGVVTTREFQAGVNYYFTANVRLMGNVVVPFDQRTYAGTGALMRWQIQF